MADATWPAGLPDIQLGPIRLSDEPNTITSSMSAGPPKVRRRSTARVERLSFNLWLNGSELAIFQSFYRDTLKDGTLPFDWTRPDTEAAETYRFAKPPEWSLEVPALAPADRRWGAQIDLATEPS